MPVAKAIRSAVFVGVLFAANPAAAWSLSDLFQHRAESAQPAKITKSNHARKASHDRHAATSPGCHMSSWYGGGPKKYEPNTHTASGARFDKWAMTVAHRTLPFGTRLHLSYNGRSVDATVNDRGPAAWTGRQLDVSKGVATRLGFLGQGTACLTF